VTPAPITTGSQSCPVHRSILASRIVAYETLRLAMRERHQGGYTTAAAFDRGVACGGRFRWTHFSKLLKTHKLTIQIEKIEEAARCERVLASPNGSSSQKALSGAAVKLRQMRQLHRHRSRLGFLRCRASRPSNRSILSKQAPFAVGDETHADGPVHVIEELR
jgi:hypothetical protein